MTLLFRAAEATDTDVIALMHESSRPAIDATFELRPGTAAAFLAADFQRGAGIFGFRHQLLGVDADEKIVSTATVYPGGSYQALSLRTVQSAWAHFGIADFARIVRRTAASAAVFPPPREGTLYLANFCVRREFRSAGHGARLLDQVAARAAAEQLSAVELDVAFDNPRAQAMYERHGFTVTAERRTGRAAGGVGGGIRRMTRAVG